MKQMFGIISRADGMDFSLCEICDNLTPVLWIDEEAECLYCVEAYGLV